MSSFRQIGIRGLTRLLQHVRFAGRGVVLHDRPCGLARSGLRRGPTARRLADVGLVEVHGVRSGGGERDTHQFVQQLLHVSHDRVAHRRIALIIGDVRPVGRLSGSCGLLGQSASDREDVRRVGDVRVADRRRLSGRHGHAVGLESFDGADRQVVLRGRAAEGRAKWQSAFRGELVEIGGRDDALRRAVLADEHDGFVAGRWLECDAEIIVHNCMRIRALM